MRKRLLPTPFCGTLNFLIAFSTAVTVLSSHPCTIRTEIITIGFISRIDVAISLGTELSEMQREREKERMLAIPSKQTSHIQIPRAIIFWWFLQS